MVEHDSIIVRYFSAEVVGRLGDTGHMGPKARCHKAMPGVMGKALCLRVVSDLLGSPSCASLFTDSRLQAARRWRRAAAGELFRDAGVVRAIVAEMSLYGDLLDTDSAGGREAAEDQPPQREARSRVRGEEAQVQGLEGRTISQQTSACRNGGRRRCKDQIPADRQRRARRRFPLRGVR